MFRSTEDVEMEIKIKRAVVMLALCVFIKSVYADHQTGNESQDWQHKMLFHPSEQNKQREDSGFVMIYDGMTDKTVDRALDEHFDRMSSMMFIRTVVTDPAGEPLIDEETGSKIAEDDDC
jgi:hypothetical protein